MNSLSLEQTQSLGGLFIDQVKNILISFLAARLVINGSMTLGMMMAMQYIIGQLNAPVSQFINFMGSTQDAKMSLERLGEIYNREDEESEEKPKNADIIFNNVVFQYEGPNSKRILDGLTMRIKTGKVNAIVGVSGSGKTTILKPVLAPFTAGEKITYMSSDKKKVSVSTRGVVKGLKSGKVRVTVKSGKQKLVIIVIVK